MLLYPFMKYFHVLFIINCNSSTPVSIAIFVSFTQSSKGTLFDNLWERMGEFVGF